MASSIPDTAPSTAASWADFTAAEPGLAATVEARFGAYTHHTLATLRKDGSPRTTGIEVRFLDGDLWLGMMPGSLKALDLRRDPRLALHSPTFDPPQGDESGWAGDAKVAGRAVETSKGNAPSGGHRFRIDILEMVLTRVGDPADHLVIESWHPDRGLETRRRA